MRVATERHGDGPLPAGALPSGNVSARNGADQGRAAAVLCEDDGDGECLDVDGALSI